MKWVLCQVASTVGDIQSNVKKIQTLVTQYKHCDLLIFPELMTIGYPPEDLLEQSHIIQKQQLIVKKMVSNLSSPAILTGTCSLYNASLYNSALYIQNNQIQTFYKSFLATSDTFDEQRFFSTGKIDRNILRINNKNVLVLICEDLWKIHHIPNITIDFIICINASPFFPEQLKNRVKMAKKIIKKTKASLFYVNRVGGQDEWVFDGSSFVLNQNGELVFQAPSFQEKIQIINPLQLKKKKVRKPLSVIQQKKEAIQLGIKDFLSHHSFKKVHLGLSGGLDSALVACLCQEVVGKKNMTVFFLSSPFSRKKSQTLSQQLAKELGIQWSHLSIASTYHHILSIIKHTSSVAKENIQARLRSLFLMTYSNTYSSVLIGTSNKSELAVGYSTLYGDLSGAFFPIGDLYKTEVQKMAKTFYKLPSIKQILKQKPSAELKLDQLDEDDLPPYSKLDPILKNMIENKTKPVNKIEKEIYSMILNSEFKRRQSPFVLKLSAKSFGRGRRYPIAVKI